MCVSKQSMVIFRLSSVDHCGVCARERVPIVGNNLYNILYNVYLCYLTVEKLITIIIIMYAIVSRLTLNKHTKVR